MCPKNYGEREREWETERQRESEGARESSFGGRSIGKSSMLDIDRYCSDIFLAWGCPPGARFEAETTCWRWKRISVDSIRSISARSTGSARGSKQKIWENHGGFPEIMVGEWDPQFLE
jgi:hypothetical protein